MNYLSFLPTTLSIILVICGTSASLHSSSFLHYDLFNQGSGTGGYSTGSIVNQGPSGGGFESAYKWSVNSSLFNITADNNVEIDTTEQSVTERRAFRKMGFGSTLPDNKYYITGKLNLKSLTPTTNANELYGFMGISNGVTTPLTSPFLFKDNGLVFGFKRNSDNDNNDLVLYGNQNTVVLESNVIIGTDYTVVVEVDFNSSADADDYVTVWVDDASSSGFERKITASGAYFNNSTDFDFATLFTHARASLILDDFLFTDDPNDLQSVLSISIPEPHNVTLLTTLLFSFLLLHRRSFRCKALR